MKTLRLILRQLWNRPAFKVNQAIAQVNPSVAVFNFQSLHQFVSKNISFWMSRLNTWMFGFLGVAAALVTLTGLHGLVGFTARQRTREMALRLALGSGRSELFRMMLLQTGAPVACGLGLGLVLAFILSRLLESLLFEVAPLDPVVYGLAACLVGLTALTAFWSPIRRLSRLNPAILLRAE